MIVHTLLATRSFFNFAFFCPCMVFVLAKSKGTWGTPPIVIVHKGFLHPWHTLMFPPMKRKKNGLEFQWWLLWLTIGKFPGQKVICPVTFGGGLTRMSRHSHLPSDAATCHNTVACTHALAYYPTYTIATTPISPRSRDQRWNAERSKNLKRHQVSVMSGTARTRQWRGYTVIRTRILPPLLICCGAMHAELTTAKKSEWKPTQEFGLVFQRITKPAVWLTMLTATNTGLPWITWGTPITEYSPFARGLLNVDK